MILNLHYGATYSAAGSATNHSQPRNRPSQGKDTLFTFMDALISRLSTNGKYGTAATYRSTRNSFKKFRNNADLSFERIDSELMEQYQAWLHNRGLIPNTISFYMRNMRAIYKRAVDNGLTADRRPFRKVYTGIDKTEKRAIPLDAIRRLQKIDLAADKRKEFARDMFMLSFYMRGINFIDMASLRKSDLQNGHLIYRRRKTGQRLAIAWTAEMQAIVDKYPPNPTDHLLPIINKAVRNFHNAYRNRAAEINRELRALGSELQLSMPLTLYVARHSWASAARSIGIPVSTISEGMGHTSESTTNIYLASLEVSVIDKANEAILRQLSRL